MSPAARPPAAGTDFDGARLTVARRLRRKTKSALAREVAVTPTAIAQFERGDNNPTQMVVNKLALALGLPREFFGAGRPPTLLPASEAHFRSLRSTTAASREQALAYGELCLELVDLVAGYVDLPPVLLPDLDLGEDLTEDEIVWAAGHVRQAWDVDPGPISSVVQLLEKYGVVVMRLPEITDRAVDAFSSYSGQRPLVLMSPAKNDKARSRFDAAHELGHLVLHLDSEPGSKLVEQQAHQFASELLMPREEIFDHLPRRIGWPQFHELKRYWGVSLRALVYRSHALGRLSQASYRRANQQLSMWGIPEPGDLGRAEEPQLLGLARKLIVNEGFDFDALLATRRIPVEVAEEVIRAASDLKPRVSFD